MITAVRKIEWGFEVDDLREPDLPQRIDPGPKRKKELGDCLSELAALHEAEAHRKAPFEFQLGEARATNPSGGTDWIPCSLTIRSVKD